MTNRIYSILLLSLCLSVSFFTSCSKENIDSTDIIEEEVIPEVVEVETTTVEDCENQTLNINATTLNFSKDAEAIIYVTENCTDYSNTEYTFIVYDKAFDFYGATDPVGKFIAVSDGIPGIHFGSNGFPEANDVLSSSSLFEPLFVGEDQLNERYIATNVEVTIEEAGNEVGEFIRGTISGTMTNQNDATDVIDVTGNFCAPIVEICQ